MRVFVFDVHVYGVHCTLYTVHSNISSSFVLYIFFLLPLLRSVLFRRFCSFHSKFSKGKRANDVACITLKHNKNTEIQLDIVVVFFAEYFFLPPIASFRSSLARHCRSVRMHFCVCVCIGVFVCLEFNHFRAIYAQMNSRN